MKTVFCSSQMIGWEDCLQNDLYFVEWVVKPYYIIPCISIIIIPKFFAYVTYC